MLPSSLALASVGSIWYSIGFGVSLTSSTFGSSFFKKFGMASVESSLGVALGELIMPCEAAMTGTGKGGMSCTAAIGAA